jgi:hypothetical protein
LLSILAGGSEKGDFGTRAYRGNRGWSTDDMKWIALVSFARILVPTWR